MQVSSLRSDFQILAMRKPLCWCLFLLQLGLFFPVHAGDRLNFYWNLQTSMCLPSDRMDPAYYGIVTNEPQTVRGDKIVTFYENNLGLLPSIKITDWKWDDIEADLYILDAETHENTVMVNGGIPQRADFDAHLAKVERDVNEHVPAVDFSGPVIIDYESWRPLYDLNWGVRAVYKNESIAYAKSRHPHEDEKTILKIAKHEFNKAAKSFFLMTIAKIQEMRPFAKVGCYDYPMCNYDVGNIGELECNAQSRRANQELAWLMKASSALYPSTYFYYRGNMTSEVHEFYAYARVNEAIQARESLNLNLPIFPFTNINYPGAKDNFELYSDSDVDVSILITDLNIQGLIIWSTTDQMKARCPGIKKFLENVYGPRVMLQSRAIEKHSRHHCGDHGRAVAQWSRPPAADIVFRKKYRCVCDDGFYGRTCQYTHSLADEF